MKNIIVLLSLSLFVLGVQSCKKPPLPVVQEDNTGGGGNGGGGGGGEEPEVNPYVGTWDYSRVDLKNGKLSYSGTEAGTFVGTGSNIVGKVIITEKPNRYTADLKFTANVTASVFGQTQEQSTDVPKQTSGGTWTESDGEISLTDDSGQEVAIISSSSSKIVYTGNFATKIPLTGGINLDATSDVEFTITK